MRRHRTPPPAQSFIGGWRSCRIRARKRRRPPVRLEFGADVIREYDDYDDERIRLYTPVLQRVIILAAVVIAVPVMMWTITTFVRSYIARPKPPALEHVASANLPTRIPTIALSPPSPAPPPADQSAPQRLDGASASDATSPAAETRNGRPNLASLPNAAPAAAARSSASQQATRASSSAITASTTGD